MLQIIKMGLYGRANAFSPEGLTLSLWWLLDIHYQPNCKLYKLNMMKYKIPRMNGFETKW